MMNAHTPSMTLGRGAAVGPYLLGKSLGEGASGQVFSAWDRRRGRAVALKLPHERGAEALHAEARALAALDDPRIVRLVDFGPWRDRAFLAMELLEGSTLQAWLDKKPSADEVLRVLAELGRAIDRVHRVGYVHGDLKPANVHVTRGGDLRLLDFGLASTSTRTRSRAGTPAYLAPEIFDGQPLSADSDRFAFAVIVFESFTQRRPFAGRNWVMQVLDPQPPVWTGVPEPLRDVLARALAPRPDQRPSLRVLIDTLETARCTPTRR
jgi:serine/threonine protein kinase